MRNKIIFGFFFTLVALSLLAPLWVFKDLLFPYVTSKAFYFRVLIEAAFPFYLYLVLADFRLRPNLKQPINLLVLVFLAINFITSFTGINVDRSLWGNFERMGGSYYLLHLVLLYFYVLLIGQAGGKWLKRFLWASLAAALLVALNGIAGKIGLGNLTPDPSLPTRVSSTLGNPIYVGSYLMVPMLLAAFLGFEQESKPGKVFYFASSAVLLVCMYFSGTRGALVGFIAGGFLAAIAYLITTSSKRVKTYGWAGVLFLAAAAVSMFVYSEHLPQGSLARRLFQLRDSNTEARLIQWKFALQGVKERPVLGFGPENYYYVSNKYFDPEIYKYDRSWFDKPHNYILEILVTNGVFGLLAYLGMFAYSLWAFYKAFQAGYFGAAGFSVLCFAILAYQIQNLTVFDTVPASITFFSLMGFAAYLSHAAAQDKKIAGSEKKKSKEIRVDLSLPIGSAALASVLAIYAIVATNILPAKAGKAVNYGYAYGQAVFGAQSEMERKHNLETAIKNFDEAINNHANFDGTETASKFIMFAAGLAQSATAPEARNVALETINKAIDYQLKELGRNDTYAASWESLATGYMAKSFLSGQGYDFRAEDAVNKALELTPRRLEAWQQMVQILLLKNQLDQAVVKLQELIREFPTNVELKAQAGLIAQAQGKSEQAVMWLKQANEDGYIFQNFQQAKLLLEYYEKNGQLDRELALLESIARTDSNNVDLGVRLAIVYFLTGQTEKARELSVKIIQFDPTRAKDLKNIMAQPPGTASTTKPSVK